MSIVEGCYSLNAYLQVPPHVSVAYPISFLWHDCRAVTVASKGTFIWRVSLAVLNCALVIELEIK